MKSSFVTLYCVLPLRIVKKNYLFAIMKHNPLRDAVY